MKQKNQNSSVQYGLTIVVLITAIFGLIFLFFRQTPSIPSIPIILRYTPTPVLTITPTVQPGKFDVDQYLHGLKDANYSFSTIEDMQVGKSYMVHLLVASSEPIQILITEVAQPGGRTEGGTVRVDTLMVAHLTGSSFKIEPVSPEEQAVSLQERTEWVWQITPLQEGKQQLYLSIYAKILIPGTQTQRQVKTLEREIQVHVTFGQKVSGFVQNNWQWLWTFIFVPAAGFVIARSSKNKQHSQPTSRHLKNRN